ncbi:hypothetical protein [Nitratifractor salsuginis]|uniref:Roadblock/LC7 family protein n=1 Tax=Nitratifractor salsuginis (strain DSM 16511 / JCM 12458 / E9I37-1) TaxID=749222 RepID=E6X042_NITSE|nr:hypothetical protein [Nitratifractor salsuginis]ADV46765.1 hypothetical protein Nitsa_1517 [Nitratifractor salsuginis DSM 16511]
MIEFDQAMKRLRSVNGYLGSAVLNFSGETLYMDEENTNVDIAYSASIFNDAFRMISESSLDVGFAEASLVEARTEDGHVFLVNSSGDTSGDNFSKLTTFAIFRDDGNVALAKMIMEKAVKNMSQAMKEL